MDVYVFLCPMGSDIEFCVILSLTGLVNSLDPHTRKMATLINYVSCVRERVIVSVTRQRPPLWHSAHPDLWVSITLRRRLRPL